MSVTRVSWLAGGATLAAVVSMVPLTVSAQDAEGFDGYIQSGTCAAPSDALRVSLEGEGDHDITPYLARTGEGDETVVLGYYGAPGVPGFGYSTIFSEDEAFSLVITDTSGAPAACGELLEPDVDRFGEVGVAVAQLLPVGQSDVQGVAIVERAQLERENDVTPTRVRVLLANDSQVSATNESAVGFDGYVQGGSCDAPADRLRVQLEGGGDHDVEPFLAVPSGSTEEVTVAFAGAAGVPGFGLAATYTDEVFSLVLVAPDTTDAVACGDILEPDDDSFTEAGMALVQLRGLDGTVQGFAVIERVGMERELDVTPTRARIVLFAPPATT